MDIEEAYELARTGDRISEEILYRQLLVSFRVIVRHRIEGLEDGEDVVQDTLAAVFSKYKVVNIERSFAGWAHKLLHFKILDYYKAHKVRVRRFAEPSTVEGNDPVVTSNPGLLIRLKSCLEKMQKVDRRYLQILDLVYRGFSTREICLRLKMTSNHYYVTLHRARRWLRECLRSGENDV